MRWYDPHHDNPGTIDVAVAKMNTPTYAIIAMPSGIARMRCHHVDGDLADCAPRLFTQIIAAQDSMMVTMARNTTDLSGSKCRDDSRLKYEGIKTIVSNQVNSSNRRHHIMSGEFWDTTKPPMHTYLVTRAFSYSTIEFRKKWFGQHALSCAGGHG